VNGLRQDVIDAMVKHFEDQRGHPPEQMQINDLTEYADAALRVLAEHSDTQQVREHTYRCAFLTRAERAEADLAAAQMALRVARHRLDKVRALAEQTRLYPDTLRAILDAPARPAGHDETGQ
jgi:hypothetical protein